MQWEKLFSMQMDAYVNLVYEFYSLLRMSMDAQNNLLDYVIEFWSCGKKCRATLVMLTEWLECDYKGILKAPSTF